MLNDRGFGPMSLIVIPASISDRRTIMREPSALIAGLCGEAIAADQGSQRANDRFGS
jgi:hypothetical protein